jgi:hypothetical protein
MLNNFVTGAVIQRADRFYAMVSHIGLDLKAAVHCWITRKPFHASV